MDSEKIKHGLAEFESATYWQATGKLGKGYGVAYATEADLVDKYIKARAAGLNVVRPATSTKFGTGLLDMIDGCLANAVTPPPPPPTGTAVPFGLNANSGLYHGFTHLDAYGLVLCSAADAPAAVKAGGKVLQYGSGASVNRNWWTGVDWQTANANGWLLKDSAGNLLINIGYTSNNIGDIGSSGYQQEWIKQTLARLAITGAKGVFLDDVDRDPRGLCGGFPAKYPDLASWNIAVLNFVKMVGPALEAKGYYVAVNAAGFTKGDGGSDDGTLEATFWQTFAPYVSALCHEYFMETSEGSLTIRTLGTEWTQHADGWQKLVSVAQDAGCDFIGITYGNDQQHFLYGLGCFLKSWNGKGGGFVWSPSNNADPYSTIQPYLGRTLTASVDLAKGTATIN